MGTDWFPKYFLNAYHRLPNGYKYSSYKQMKKNDGCKSISMYHSKYQPQSRQTFSKCQAKIVKSNCQQSNLINQFCAWLLNNLPALLTIKQRDLSKYNIRLTKLSGFLLSDKLLATINYIELRLVKSGIELKAAFRFPNDHIWPDAAQGMRAKKEKGVLYIWNTVFSSQRTPWSKLFRMWEPTKSLEIKLKSDSVA